LRSRAVYTNNPVGGAFRGFGVTQALAAVELAMEALARELGMCPLELRRINAVPPGGSLAPGHVPGGSNHLADCLDAIAGHELWRGREDWKVASGPQRVRGVGVSSALHAMGYGPVVPDVAEAKLELTLAGGLVLYSGVVDMGQGNASLCACLVAEALGQDPASVDLVLPDTKRTLNSGSSSASRTSFTFGRAALGAAEELRAAIMTAAAGLLGVPPGEMELIPSRAFHRPSGRQVGLDGVAASMADEQRLATYRYQAPTSKQRPSDDRALALHGLPHEIFSFGAMLAGVELDTLTGRVLVARLVMACDVGKVLSPLMLAQQAHGGAAQGLGYALLEDMPSRRGIIETPDLATYLIPTALDLPEMELIAVDGFEPQGPAGLKGAGELPIDLPLPAVAAAVADACGWLPERFPIRASEVLSALEGKR
jgi:CO/xanthine dehydrogenase Mo-binding subunit